MFYDVKFTFGGFMKYCEPTLACLELALPVTSGGLLSLFLRTLTADITVEFKPVLMIRLNKMFERCPKKTKN